MDARVRGHEGWVWLEPSARSLHVRRAAVGAALLSVTVVVLALAPQLPPGGGQAALVALAVLTGWMLYRLWRVAWTRLGVSRIGVMVQEGGRSGTFGWEAIREVGIERRSPARARVVVRLEDQTLRAPASFAVAAVRDWAARASSMAPDHVRWTG